MTDLPVVVVVATHGEDRLHLLTERALSSVASQTSKADLVVVVSDNDPLSDFLEEGDIKRCFDAEYQSNVCLVPNTRTKHFSGTGSWNTGILKAFSCFGEECWVAILDDDDEWEESHIEMCLKAAGENCQWVVSGITRCSASGRKKEKLLASEPKAGDFFTTNPGIQGSNLFVRVGSLLGAGLFDEWLPSTTDRDLCIRLCDLLSRSEDWFSSTGLWTCIHHADTDRARVSSRGSPAKIQGLKRFFHKWAPRMSDSQRGAFKERAASLFDCEEQEFALEFQGKSKVPKLEAWSGSQLPLHMGTFEMLPDLSENTSCAKKKVALFGIITSDVRRILSLLDDLSAASASQHCNFNPFIVVFANSVNTNLASVIKAEISNRKLRGHVICRTSPAVDSILQQCHDVESPGKKLPIAMSRTVLQVYLYHMPNLGTADAVVILDDDKRLPKFWSPFTSSQSQDGADILIGRDLRTPPNPSLFSLRTNLIDLIFNMDLVHAKGVDKDAVKSYCLSQPHLEYDKFDWYYDLSSSKRSHLEMPVYSGIEVDGQDFPRKLLHDFLVGTPLCRDVIPLESGPTSQRGGCMVIMNKGRKSFEPLAVQQHAPSFSDGATISYTRRSDSFWCKQITKRGSITISVDKQLYVYHDNRFDSIAPPAGIRRNVVQEVVGGILCREVIWRKKYKHTRLLELRGWLLRVRGILTSLRSRSYCTKELVREFINPLEEILDYEKWEEEVFTVIEKAFDTSLQNYEPNPVNFVSRFLKLDPNESKMIEMEWNTQRIEEAHKILYEATGEDGVYVGVGSEGVSFRVNESLYKVFDLAHSRLPSKKTIKLLGSSYVSRLGLGPPILKRPYQMGTSYRGGHGLAMVRMLRYWKNMKLFNTNISPDNLLFNKVEQTLEVIDIGRDVKYEQSEYLYNGCFREMCKRAYLCFRFGDCASNPYTLKKLKQWMREDSSSLHLAGFETFMRSVYDSQEVTMIPLRDKLDEIQTVCSCVISPEHEDCVVIELMNKAITGKASGNISRIAIAIADPFQQKMAHDHATKRRPLWFYRRHLRRLQQNQHSFAVEEDNVVLVDPSSFHEYVAFHIFVMDFDSNALQDCDVSSQDAADHKEKEVHHCHLLIKSCPLEFQTILSDVRRTVHCLEPTTNFKSIVLVADLSKTDGFARQYVSADTCAYNDALKKIEEERLVDHIVKFEGNDPIQAREMNKRWLGRDCPATHSSQGQHFASTFFGFEFIKDLDCFDTNDIVLQMDSDIILHSEGSGDGIIECTAIFEDPNIVSFAFPILSSRKSESRANHLNQDGKPFRFEIRCSFVHVDRMLAMLPFQIPEHEVSTESCMKKGWWHTLDANIQKNDLKSCRGAARGGTLFFIHPPNAFKEGDRITKLSLVADLLSSHQISTSDLSKKLQWKRQLNQVNLQSTGKAWLRERHETIVIAIDLSSTSYGSAMHSFEYLRRMRGRKVFWECGVILFDNGSANREDITSELFERAKVVLCNTHLTAIAWRKQLTTQDLQLAIRSMCTNSNALVFISRGNDFNLHSAMCLLPNHHLKVCFECGSYYDDNCECLDDLRELDGIPCTPLPVSVPSIQGTGFIQLKNTTFFAGDIITEGKLRIEITALVNGIERIKGAENVCVRIHSDCLTGDNFYSMKCDCGMEKLQFMNIMAKEEKLSRPSALVYIKGHEGRGNGLFNKIKAYKHLDQHPNESHIDALHAIGCESDVRKYDAAVKFLRYKLRMKSIKLYTNNPEKIQAAEKYFGSDVSCQAMPATPCSYNEKYLKEKKELMSHKGLL